MLKRDLRMKLAALIMAIGFCGMIIAGASGSILFTLVFIVILFAGQSYHSKWKNMFTNKYKSFV